MKILERMRLEALIKNIPLTEEGKDPQTEQELKQVKKDLNSILNKWTFGWPRIRITSRGRGSIWTSCVRERGGVVVVN